LQFSNDISHEGPEYVDEEQARENGWLGDESAMNEDNGRRSSILGETLNLLGGGPMMIGTRK
jgi:hypothetical protein